MKVVEAAPFLKWAGGKGEFAKRHRRFLPSPEEVLIYAEPFLGGGAVFFRGGFARVRPALLCDTNRRLILTYEAVRDDVEGVIEELGRQLYEESHYYDVRERFNEERNASPTQIAAWMIFLNKTCVNGLYRENKDGGFNVGFGTYNNPKICNAPLLRACSRALRGVDLACRDFEERLEGLGRGSFVFLDSPYAPAQASGFTGYSGGGGGWQSVLTPQGALFTSEQRQTEHERLAGLLPGLHERGARFTLTNSDTPETRKLFAAWQIDTVMVKRAINSDGDARGEVSELVVRNWT